MIRGFEPVMVTATPVWSIHTLFEVNKHKLSQFEVLWRVKGGVLAEGGEHGRGALDVWYQGITHYSRWRRAKDVTHGRLWLR